jgi:serine/threonine-protein kinase
MSALMTPDPLLGRTLSHYTLIERLGTGGMGVVYRARDERLPREVAIKLLPDGMPGNREARARFHREAIALSRLRHPAIALLYEFDHDAGRDYLVIEHVTGETLEVRLRRGPLPEPELRAIAGQLAAALEAAHAHGVIHRDLKPGNIMLTTEGQVKVLDFGVARLIETPAEDPTRTSGETRLGTLAYMAPEQLFSPDVDARADFYALGAVLYHAATGRPPFLGTGSSLAGQIMNEAAPPPRSLRPDLSREIEALILRCLEKNAAARPASAGDVGAALRGEAGTAPVNAAPDLSSLAVLPLENLSGDPAEEYFADGMTDTLITALAQISALRVISRTSAMQYKGRRPALADLVRELGVGAVVEGTVMRAGDRVRISAQLVDARGDRAVWAQSFDRELCDVLTLQNEVAQTIAEAVRIHVTPRERAMLGRAHALNPRALELFLQARFFWGKRTAPGLLRSVELFREALEIEPEYASAWAGLADAWNILGVFRIEQPAAAFAKGREAAMRARALQPESVEALTSLAFAAHYSDWDWSAAERDYRQAILLQPGYVSAHHWYADFLSSQGRTEEGLSQAREARALDPLSAVIGLTHGAVLYFGRRYREAADSIHEQIELHPDSSLGHLDLGRVLEELGDPAGALREFETGARLAGTNPEAHAPRAHGLARAGRIAEAEAVLARVEASRAERYVSPYTLATICIALGDPERAFRHLEQAFAERDPMMVFLRVHPRLDPLRGDPRFPGFLDRMGLKP